MEPICFDVFVVMKVLVYFALAVLLFVMAYILVEVARIIRKARRVMERLEMLADIGQWGRAIVKFIQRRRSS